MQIFCNAGVSVTTDTAGTLLYQVPANQEAVVHNLYISNNSETDSVKIEVKLVKSGASFTSLATSTPGAFYIISKYLPIDPLNTIELKPINLMAGDKIMLRKSNSYGTLSGTMTTSQFSGNITTSEAVTTVTGLRTTVGLQTGYTLTKVTGSGAFGTNARITAINSSTQITITCDSPSSNVAGNIYFNIGGGTTTERVTIITGISSTSLLRTGLTLAKASGTGAFGTNPVISKVDSETQITVSSGTADTAGSISFVVSDTADVHAVASILREIKDF